MRVSPPLQPLPLLSRSEAAIFLNVSRGTLAKWSQRGREQVPVIRLGGKVLYRESDLVDFVERHRHVCTV